jgi:hypothetical protein
MLKSRPVFICLLALAIGLTTAAGASAREEHAGASPYLITVGDPDDPLYANAGDNLRTGVGSIFIEFEGIPEGGFLCTASVIGPRYILTAAHCVREAGDTVRRIQFILSAGQPAPIMIDAAGFAVHPWFDFFVPLYGAFAHGDVAVIELAEDLTMRPDIVDLEIYGLYADPDEFGQKTRHYGYGLSGKGNKGATGDASFFYSRTGLNTYEQTMAPFLGDGVEDQLLHDFDSGGRKHNAMEWWFTSKYFCKPGKDDNPPQAQDGQCTTFKDGSYPDFKGYGKLEVGIAPGDSGGPGFIGDKIAGLHSFGFTHPCEGVTNGTDFNCVLDSSYGEMAGDTRVSYFATWIQGVLDGYVPTIPVPEPLPATASSHSVQVQSKRARFFMDKVFARTLRLPTSPPQ